MQIQRFTTRAGAAGLTITMGAVASLVGACASQTTSGYDDAGPGSGSSSGSSGSSNGGSSNGGSSSGGSSTGSYVSGSSGSSGGSSTGSYVSGSSGSTAGSTASGASGASTSGSGAAGSTSGTASSGTGASGTAASGTGASGTAASGSTATGTFKTCPAGGASCAATTSAAAVPLVTNYQSVVGTGGYAYVLCDPSGSTSCIPSTALCTAGTTLAGPGSSMVYGSGIGVNIGQAMASTIAGPYAIAATATGIKVAFDNVPPAGVQLIIDSAGMDFCSLVTAAGPTTVPWSSFTQYCSVSPTAPALGKNPPTMPTHINFQVPVGTAAGTFNFCVTSLGFGP